MNLLLGLANVNKGALLINGISLIDINLGSFRNLFSTVNQSPLFFDDSIFNNLIFGFSGGDLSRLDLDEIRARLKSVIEAADANFIYDLPGDFNYQVGEGGNNLSQGQRQRLAIARALIRNASVYVFDEALANIEISSARKIFKSLKETAQNAIVVVISHQKEILDECDHILTLKKGTSFMLSRESLVTS